MKKKLILIFLGIIILIVSTFGFLLLIKKKPPEEEIKDAREALIEAKKAKANIYSKAQFEKAVNMYDSAMFYWGKENKKVFFLRNYEEIKEFAILAKRLASDSHYRSKTNSSELQLNLKHKLNTLKKYIENFHPVFANLPVSENLRNQYSQGKLFFEEAKIAFGKEDYHTCEKKLINATQSFNTTFKETEIILTDYFKNYPLWIRQVKQTLEESKKSKSYAVVIDKFSRKCHIYYKGILSKSFEIELGRNWIGNKQQKGDKTTPEGLYKITAKKERNQTKYYKALMLNYPNEEDKKRFEQNKKNGTLSKTAEIGNLIEIHGEGGKGIDWTDGCIALKNEDMDVIFRLCNTGTRVTIIGSTKPLDEIIKFN